jgi:ligand-binding SRPBCC domain-containing protein
MEQWIPQPINEAFAFFKEATNLEKITPDEMNFKVLKQSTENIEEGTVLNYSLSVHKIPMRWKSKITHWNPDSKFSDVQLNGPYDYWVHQHEFEEKDGGTLIKDHVRYKVPVGLAGDLIANRFIRNDLEKIFTYRQKKINEMFNKIPKKEAVSHV